MNDARSAAASAAFSACSDELQLRLLNAQLAYAAANSAYYRAALGGVGAFRQLRELRELPMMSEETIKTQGSRLSCVSAASVARIVSLLTSGTTDRPKRLFFTKNDLERTVAFFCEGMQWLTEPGMQVGIFFPGLSPDGLNDLLSRGLAAFNAKPVTYGPISDALRTAEALREASPEVLVGMPWQLRALAIALPQLRPHAVLLSADYVPETLRRFLRAQWCCPVLTHYGLTESGYGLAVQHPDAAGMYYRRSDFILEVIDPNSGAPLPYGEQGELVLTTLRREAMPLIRYRTGDLAVMTDKNKIARIPGRLGIADEFYQMQETLAPLPWLVDFTVGADAMLAHVTDRAPADCEQQLHALCGRKVHCEYSMCLFDAGKRIG